MLIGSDIIGFQTLSNQPIVKNIRLTKYPFLPGLLQMGEHHFSGDPC